MKKHIKIFTDYYSIGIDDYPICQYCNSSKMVDIHHLVLRSQNGKDHIDNLIGLCRVCHDKAHKSKEFNEELKEHKLLIDPPY